MKPRSQHSSAYIFKIPKSICTILAQLNVVIFWTCLLLYFHQLPNTNWCRLAKDNSLFSYHCSDAKCIPDMTSPWHSMMLRAHETFCESCCRSNGQHSKSTMLAAVEADHRLPLSSHLATHCCSWFCSEFVQTSRARYVMLNSSWHSLAFVESEIWVFNFCQVAPLCITNLLNMESTNVLRIKWHWITTSV